MDRSSQTEPTRVMILGGTSEATALAEALAGRPDIAATLSYAGRTVAPILQPVPIRVGGFGGVDGLVRTLRDERVDILVDATHPFATQISQNAVAAAPLVPCRLLTVTRAAWAPEPGDDWREVASMAEAAQALGSKPKRVFLTVGSLQLAAFAAAPHHRYLVRTVDPVAVAPLAHAEFIEARGPFDVDGELRLMREHRIEVLVTKNSGGTAAVAKLVAARQLGIPVILVRRPEGDDRRGTVGEALAAIDAHRAALRRGV